jgi:pyrimidine deaminase RibD-like protein/NTP pyrophosphatase (non-canonical NTP hydrolase)
VSNGEQEYMQLAIAEAQKSTSEDGRTHPRVGVVVVKDGQIIATAYRGEYSGEHAEYFALERKLKDRVVAGATLYTTLEPSTVRNHPKVACAQRLVDRKITRVIIGILDPNPIISGTGQRLLRDANIETTLFPAELMAQVEDQNREFVRSHRQAKPRPPVTQAFITANRGRSLDVWYRTVNAIYWNRNFYRDQTSIFTHLIEVIGGLSQVASQKRKTGTRPEEFVPKAFAWWMALCGKVGVKSVADMVWTKFPNTCAYCHKSPHDPDECRERKLSRPGPDWESLARIGEREFSGRANSLGDWQRMFSRIYPVQQTEDFGPTFARLAEELGELAEALRVFSAVPGYFLSEAADVFAWLMHIQNLIDREKGVPREERGKTLEIDFCNAYPDQCLDCESSLCRCPPILESTVGRIGHEVATGQPSYGAGGSFLTPDKALLLFQLTKVDIPQ